MQTFLVAFLTSIGSYYGINEPSLAAETSSQQIDAVEKSADHQLSEVPFHFETAKTCLFCMHMEVSKKLGDL